MSASLRLQPFLLPILWAETGLTPTPTRNLECVVTAYVRSKLHWNEIRGVNTKGLSRSRLSDCNRFLLPCSCLPSCGGYALKSASLTKRSGHDHRRGNDGSHRNTHVHYYLCLGGRCIHV